MAATIIDGKRRAECLTLEVASAVTARVDMGKSRPGLAVVLVGEDPASHVYVRNKRRTTEASGMLSFSHDLSLSTTQAELVALVDRLNADPAVNGILIQLPLPAHVDAFAITERIDPRKDVDGLHSYNIGRLVLRQPILRPCTPWGCMTLLRDTGVDLVGKGAVVIGQSHMVGRPMAIELLNARCTVTICHSATQDLPGIVRDADVVVAAMGKASFVKGDWIKPGAIVVDVGINRNTDGKLCGDVDFAAAKEVAGWITPVPGGVGPMTIATLLANTLKAAEWQDQAGVR